ncbi:MAG TPA: hypothetical protein VMT45_06425 [Thermoanaerobaculaceae bacterium]|nr:hypothetical protein [Thermoanaerobaculaceae bacterium]
METAAESDAARTPERQPRRPLLGLRARDVALLWIGLLLWFVLFLIGTLVASAPYRVKFASLEGGPKAILTNAAVVVLAYTMPNVALLCILASVLGAVGAEAGLGSDAQDSKISERDVTSPRSSAVLRGFLVYLTMISGVIVFAETPAEPTQAQYVKLAGVMSVVAFLVSYRPALFGRLLERGGKILSGSRDELGGTALDAAERTATKRGDSP